MIGKYMMIMMLQNLIYADISGDYIRIVYSELERKNLDGSSIDPYGPMEGRLYSDDSMLVHWPLMNRATLLKILPWI